MKGGRGKELAWDIGLPVATFYGLHLLGVGDFAALLTASVAAVLRIVWVALRDRSLNRSAAIALLVCGIGLALTFVSGDARLMLLKGPIMAAVVGVVFLVTAARGRRPLTLALDQSWAPSRAQQLAEDYQTHPHIRHGYRVSSAVWGTVILVEVVIRIPLIFLLSIDVMVGLSAVLTVATTVGLIAWKNWYMAQLTRRAAGLVRPVPAAQPGGR